MRRGAHARERRSARTLAAATLTASLATALATACRGSAAEPVASRAPSLVGVWKGTVDGTPGRSVLTLTMHADSSMTGENENPSYSRIEGVWTVAGGWLAVTARTAGGVVVTLGAPASASRLVGTWRASTGAGGTFDMLRQEHRGGAGGRTF